MQKKRRQYWRFYMSHHLTKFTSLNINYNDIIYIYKIDNIYYVIIYCRMHLYGLTFTNDYCILLQIVVHCKHFIVACI